MKNLTSKEQPRKTLQDYEDAMDRQLSKLETIDEEDQSSYKIADMIIRNSETIKTYFDAKCRAELIRHKTVRIVDQMEMGKDAKWKQLNGGTKK